MPPHRFFTDDGFEFAALIALGSAPYRMAEVGEVYSTTDRITEGDADSWFDEWMATSERVRAMAEAAEAAGHPVSARDAYLRAANYAGVAFFYVLATTDPARALPTWRRHRDSFDRAMALWGSPVEKVAIPYEQTHLQGYFWSGGPGRRPTLILNNGSDGPVSDMLSMGVVDAVERGYHAVTFDGPGQGYALYEDGLFFRHDWEAVISPVVDFLGARDDVDPDRIALLGVSQGGYWVARAAAFEHRLAAVVADPGVVRVADSWTSHFPAEMLALVEAGRDAEFDAALEQAVEANPALTLTAAKRLEPFGLSSVAEVIRELGRWDLTEVAGAIACPTLITDPEDEQFWPGQSRQLYDLITHPARELLPFTADEGANWHCEPMAPQLRAQRILDWLEQTLPLRD